MTGMPVPFMLAYLDISSGIPPLWRLAAAGAASASCMVCGFLLLSHPWPGRVFGGCAALFSFVAALPYLMADPFAALLGLICLISVAFSLYETPPRACKNGVGGNKSLQRARWGAVTVLAVIGFSLIISKLVPPFIIEHVVAASALIAQLLFIPWAWQRKAEGLKIFFSILNFSFTGLLIFSLYRGGTIALPLIFALAAAMLLFLSNPVEREREHGWEALVNHPARLLLSTFLFLCFLGTFLLVVPGATRQGEIALVDAAFTSVSGVCVTGLVVLDTPEAFTGLGQAFILLLIQLGGLGIMGIAVVALHAMGRRLSLNQERLLTTMTDSDHKNLMDALVRILKFTFLAEGFGTLMLSIFFYASGDAVLKAVWRGVFTAVSAFCNAGFSLQSNSMIEYQNSPFILHTVALLIILGGMAPATALIAPKWLMGRRIPVAPRIVLTTTVVLLVSGFLFFLAFEWNGVLSGLSIGDKIHNAWFQSATLRTAGFNSVDVAGVVSPTFLVMICFMFIGGSPGGTAGGVKTATVGILAMTVWANINNRKSVIFQNRRLPAESIYRAIAIVACGAAVWLVVVLMLEVTQQISGRDIIFEVTSAIGTVGLSTGATAKLDEIGKVIVMMAMFAGRIGPLTLFMLLGDDLSIRESRCPDIKINLT